MGAVMLYNYTLRQLDGQYKMLRESWFELAIPGYYNAEYREAVSTLKLVGFEVVAHRFDLDKRKTVLTVKTSAQQS